MVREDKEAIASLALKLLRAEPEEERGRLMRYAEREFDKWGLTVLGAVRCNPARPAEFVMDLIEENPALGDWINARSISVEDLLEKDEFLELINWLAPGYFDG